MSYRDTLCGWPPFWRDHAAASLEAPPCFTEGRVEALQREFIESMSAARSFLDSFVVSALGDGASAPRRRHSDGVRPGASLIVRGTHGRGGWNRWALGSVAERVLRQSHTPVLTLRGGPPDAIRRILCPVSNTAASRNALAHAVELASRFDAPVTLLHVRGRHSAGSIDNLCAWAPSEARSRCDIREMEVEGDAAEDIVRLARDYDLVVLGAPRCPFFEELVLGTTTLRAVRHAACPVRSVPAPPEH